MLEISKYVKVPSVFSLRNYLLGSLKLETAQARYSQMFLCGLATSVPLVVGLYYGHPNSAIFGSLTGYFLTLNDHFGALSHRLMVLTLTFFTILGGLFLGLILKGDPIWFCLGLGILSYWMGLMGGEGAELERAFLFAGVEMIATYHSPAFGLSRSPYILAYAFMSYLLVITASSLHSWFSKKPPSMFAFLTDSLKAPLASKTERHLHALSYMLVAILSYWLVTRYQIERGYWVIITVMLVLKPDRKQSLLRSYQRLFGTALGVLLTEPLIIWCREPMVMLLVIGVGSALVPWASKKNYWLVSFVTSVVVILLLDLALVERGDTHTPLVRLYTTAYGCLLGAGGVLISKLLTNGIRARQQLKILDVHTKE